jgi:hypothetical protein
MIIAILLIMKLLQLIGFTFCVLLIVAAAGCVGNNTNNTSSQPTGTISENTQPTQATDDATTINEANATILPENDTTIIVNATIENETNST